MRRTQHVQIKVMASMMALALMFHPFAYAQDPPLPPASGNRSQTEEPASPQPDVADPVARPSAPQPSENQLPDSPGTVQPRPAEPQARPIGPAETDQSQSSDTGSKPSQQADAGKSPAAQVPSASSQSSDQVPGSSNTGQPVSSQSNTQPSTQSQQQQQSPHEPLGTAAAESVPTTGVAASRPTGAAVAPAKQRRTRSILIKVGALVGVGVAVGTTMALSQGSPSKPPGSH